MLKGKLLALFRLLASRDSEPQRSQLLASARKRLAASPCDPRLHRELAEATAMEPSFHSQLRAYAELRTAAALGDTSDDLARALERQYVLLEHHLPKLQGLDHNQSYRYRSLAAAVRRVTGSEHCRVLDVGGGDGGLSWFLPKAAYVLAEPTVNGIEWSTLPFAERSFDVVCACHVFEHIDQALRPLFLDNLAKASRDHLLLLNPFVVPDSQHPRRLELILKLTGESWAREHLECGLPELSELETYAASRGYALQIEPNGNLALSLACVYLNHMAVSLGRHEALREINSFFNDFSIESLTSIRLPVAYLVHLGVNCAGVSR